MLEAIKNEWKDLLSGFFLLVIAIISFITITGIGIGKKTKNLFNGALGKKVKNIFLVIIGIAVLGVGWVIYHVLGDDFKEMRKD